MGIADVGINGLPSSRVRSRSREATRNTSPTVLLLTPVLLPNHALGGSSVLLPFRILLERRHCIYKTCERSARKAGSNVVGEMRLASLFPWTTVLPPWSSLPLRRLHNCSLDHDDLVLPPQTAAAFLSSSPSSPFFLVLLPFFASRSLHSRTKLASDLLSCYSNSSSGTVASAVGNGLACDICKGRGSAEI